MIHRFFKWERNKDKINKIGFILLESEIFPNQYDLDVVPFARLEAFRALKLSRLESFRALKSIGKIGGV